MRPKSKQLWILWLLHLHRFMEVSQIAALAFRDASRRACQARLTTLHRKGFVQRFELQHGGFGGGRSSYVYCLSETGARVLCELEGLPLKDIRYEEDIDAAKAFFANHQLAVNRCLVALHRASQTEPDFDLLRWTSDHHARLRYMPALARRYRIVHPDAIAKVKCDDDERWFFFEIDRGTQEVSRYGKKVLRYARFLLSGTWKRQYSGFPEIRIVSSHPSRVAKLRVAAEDAIDSLPGLDGSIARTDLYVAVAWEKEFLQDPLGRVWQWVFGGSDSRDRLLRSRRQEYGPDHYPLDTKPKEVF